MLTEDLHDLDDLGLLGAQEEDKDDVMDVVPARTTSQARLTNRNMTSVPWFETMLSGSRLGNMQTTGGTREGRDGSLRVEWEITEWKDGDDQEQDDGDVSESSTRGKRKRGQAEERAEQA